MPGVKAALVGLIVSVPGSAGTAVIANPSPSDAEYEAVMDRKAREGELRRHAHLAETHCVEDRSRGYCRNCPFVTSAESADNVREAARRCVTDPMALSCALTSAKGLEKAGQAYPPRWAERQPGLTVRSCFDPWDPKVPEDIDRWNRGDFD